MAANAENLIIVEGEPMTTPLLDQGLCPVIIPAKISTHLGAGIDGEASAADIDHPGIEIAPNEDRGLLGCIRDGDVHSAPFRWDARQGVFKPVGTLLALSGDPFAPKRPEMAIIGLDIGVSSGK